MPLGLPFTPTKLYISIFWPLGFVAQQGSEGEFSLDGPNLLPSLPRCDSKEGSFLLRVPCGVRLCFTPHMVLSGCQPSAGSVIAALKDNALSSFLVLPAVLWALLVLWHGVPATASVGSVLWSTFAEEIKVIGKEGGRESSTRLVLESSPTSN